MLPQSVLNLPLSKNMAELLGALVKAIDERLIAFHESVDGGSGLVALGFTPLTPTTCKRCMGVGFMLVQPEDAEDDVAAAAPPDSDEEARGSDNGVDIATQANPAPPTGQAHASGTSAHTAAPAPVVGSGSAALGSSVPFPYTSVTCHPSVPTPSAIPTFAPVLSQPTYPTLSDPIPAAAPAILAAPINGRPQYVYTPGDPIPNESVVIPGIYSLGELTIPPNPNDAVFCSEEDSPFYVVVKGLRVGVFGGWDATSPYVTGVAGAVFRKRPTLANAFQKYIKAWNRGSVKYA